MGDSDKVAVDRREFLKGIAAGAVTGATQVTVHTQDHDHDHQDVPSDLALRVKALESLLVEKGLVDSAALDALIDTMEHKVGPRNGARVVARAWVDPRHASRHHVLAHHLHAGDDCVLPARRCGPQSHGPRARRARHDHGPLQHLYADTG